MHGRLCGPVYLRARPIRQIHRVQEKIPFGKNFLCSDLGLSELDGSSGKPGKLAKR